MDIPRALLSAQEWDRMRGGALYTFFTERMVVDVEHRRKLIVEICYEIHWLKNMLKIANPYRENNVVYTNTDMISLENLLLVVQNLEYQDKV